MNSPRPLVALYNRGGGMRGLVPAHLMARIEETTGLRMAEMVDVFSGPSTGAILNAALNIPHAQNPALPKFRARHMVKFYEREGINIFPPDRYRDFRALIHDFNNRTMKINRLASLLRHGHYNPQYLGKALRDLFGDTKLSDTMKSIIIPVYNIDGAPPPETQNSTDMGGYAVWLKNIKFSSTPVPVPNVQLYDAVLASCAAPSYFPCHHFEAYDTVQNRMIQYSGIDGNIFDNPPVNYYGALKPHIPHGKNMAMIVLGTGHTLRSFKKEDWNRFGGLGIVDPVNDLPLINIFFHASETALQESMARDLEHNFYNFNKSMLADLGKPDAPSLRIDDASETNLKSLYHFSEEILENNQKQFDQICDLLVNNRDSRQDEQKMEIKENRRWWSFFKKDST